MHVNVFMREIIANCDRTNLITNMQQLVEFHYKPLDVQCGAQLI